MPVSLSLCFLRRGPWMGGGPEMASQVFLEGFQGGPTGFLATHRRVFSALTEMASQGFLGGS